MDIDKSDIAIVLIIIGIIISILIYHFQKPRAKFKIQSVWAGYHHHEKMNRIEITIVNYQFAVAEDTEVELKCDTLWLETEIFKRRIWNYKQEMHIKIAHSTLYFSEPHNFIINIKWKNTTNFFKSKNKQKLKFTIPKEPNGRKCIIYD